MTPMLKMTDAGLRFELLADGAMTLEDRKLGATMRFSPVGLQEDGPVENSLCWNRGDRLIGEQYACRFVAEPLRDNRARIQVRGEEGEIRGGFVARFALVDGWLEIAIEDVDDSLPSLSFPARAEAVSLVLPTGIGTWQREPLPNFARKVERFCGHGFKMRWFGGYLDEAKGTGWIGVVHRGHADAGALRAGNGIAPMWLRSLGTWNGERRMRYRLTPGGYVGMAKTFRQWTQENGLFVSLEEKLASRPHLASHFGGQLIWVMMALPWRRSTWDSQWLPVPEAARPYLDGPCVSTTFRQLRAIVAEAKTLGWNKGIMQMLGVAPGGWDDTFPDSWPPEPGLGTTEDFAALMAAGDDKHLVGLLDNYADIYPQSPSFPEGIILRPDGRRLRGGIWRGGQCYLLDYASSIHQARANAREYQRHGMRDIYLDTATAVQLYENHDPARRATRADDEANRLALLRVFRDHGMTVGSEQQWDAGIPVVDWSPGIAKHQPGVTIPLWPLVFHDAQIQYYNDGGVSGDVVNVSPQPYPYPDGHVSIVNRLYGFQHSCGTVVPGNWHSFKRAIAADAKHAPWLERIAMDELVSHEFLDPDRRVERSVFSSGGAVTANFGTQPFDGIAPGDHRIIGNPDSNPNR